ncbi:leukocyte elastase inhibitor-like isoform X2 [Triplophysa dalaica]|uniref:leukocyte elastase inhibitor-like isoform X2 n=1 Tax=Triplophysa dalaica TaxID=1582913 RepID=UPI0024E014F4|nr:leukocyte elastase inhibitor-like isoform X2 [Triplophysa dalaica]
MEPFSAANTQFSLNLFKKISEQEKGKNVFYSPLSISSALAMVSLGAKGNTQDQMLKVMCLNNLVKPDTVTPAHRLPAQAEPPKLQDPLKPQKPIQGHCEPPKVQDPLKPQKPIQGHCEPPKVQDPLKPQKPVQGPCEPPKVQDPLKPQKPVQGPCEPPKVQDPLKPQKPKHQIPGQDQCEVPKVQDPLKPQKPFQGQCEPPKVQDPLKPQKPFQGQCEPTKVQDPQKPQKPVQGQGGPPKLQEPLKHQLPVPVKEDLIHSSFSKLISDLNKPGVPYMLNLANRLYGEKSFQFIDKFIRDSQKYYQAGLEPVDFKTNAEAARVNINNWVEKNTQGKIKNLLAERTVSAMTRLVLVNAIYFKSNWEKKFPKEATVEKQFKLNKNKTKPVKMMNQKSKFPLSFIQEVNSQIVELPYVGKNLSMLIILPNEIEDDSTGLQKLEKTLTYEKLMDWTKPDNMSVQEVQISLPKFKLEETYSMNRLLKSLGMVDAFEAKANFSGISTNSDLMLSDVIHKSFVEVNEEGTEAAAATGVVMVATSIQRPQVFNADHPFLFFIRHNPTNSILFYGCFCTP